MFPNSRQAKPGELADAQGGSLLNKIPKPLPWEVLEPQSMDDLNEAIGLCILLLGMTMPKPGPLDWATVPETLRRHFREVEVTNRSHPK
jgi:hypothetical protein